MRNRHDPFIEHEGVRLHYRVEGSGPPVLFIHGWALDADMWSPQFETLATRFRIIAFDRRGFGRSTGMPSISGDLRDVTHVLGTLKVERVSIVGMSQGARAALRWALAHPAAVSCLVLDGPPLEHAAENPPFEEPPMAAYRRLARSAGIDAVRQAWARHPLMQLRSSDSPAHALLREMITRYPGRDLSDAPADTPLLPEQPPAQCPRTLVINGEYDSPQRLAFGTAMARWLPGARHALIADSVHLPNLDNPAAYNAVIEGFLRANFDGAASAAEG
jgi:3-oxoadipate enol-lactonase